MLDVKNIGGELEEADDSRIRLETPAMCDSKDGRERLKSTCHWLSVHDIRNSELSA